MADKLFDLTSGPEPQTLCPKCVAELNWPALTLEQMNDVVTRLGEDERARQRVVEFAVRHGFRFYLPALPEA